MEKLVVMTEEEYKELFIKFADALRKNWKKGYGYKIVSRETGEDVLEDDDSHLCGALLMPWQEVFK